MTGMSYRKYVGKLSFPDLLDYTLRVALASGMCDLLDPTNKLLIVFNIEYICISLNK